MEISDANQLPMALQAHKRRILALPVATTQAVVGIEVPPTDLNNPFKCRVCAEGCDLYLAFDIEKSKSKDVDRGPSLRQLYRRTRLFIVIDVEFGEGYLAAFAVYRCCPAHKPRLEIQRLVRHVALIWNH